MAKKILNHRIVEIDVLRTIAIVLMVTYHTAYDLKFFYDMPIDLYGQTWEAIRILTVSLFLLVSGMASHLSGKPAKRAGIVLLAAVVVSAATYMYDSKTFIYFGILHCIGIGLLVLIPLRKLKELLIPIGAVLICIPAPTAPLPTLDYYPLLPWAGYMLIGSGIGHFLYVRNNFKLIPRQLPVLTAPGKHALLIYLIHQPIILMTLRLIW